MNLQIKKYIYKKEFEQICSRKRILQKQKACNLTKYLLSTMIYSHKHTYKLVSCFS